MFEYVLLGLLPLAVYFGWWLARNYGRHAVRKKTRVFSDQYFQGLNYLLTEQPDKAIQVFLELAEVNQETVETHMALGIPIDIEIISLRKFSVIVIRRSE